MQTDALRSLQEMSTINPKLVELTADVFGIIFEKYYRQRSTRTALGTYLRI